MIVYLVVINHCLDPHEQELRREGTSLDRSESEFGLIEDFFVEFFNHCPGNGILVVCHERVEQLLGVAEQVSLGSFEVVLFFLASDCSFLCGHNNLPAVLLDHFLVENHDASECDFYRDRRRCEGFNFHQMLLFELLHFRESLREGLVGIRHSGFRFFCEFRCFRSLFDK